MSEIPYECYKIARQANVGYERCPIDDHLILWGVKKGDLNTVIYFEGADPDKDKNKNKSVSVVLEDKDEEDAQRLMIINHEAKIQWAKDSKMIRVQQNGDQQAKSKPKERETPERQQE